MDEVLSEGKVHSHKRRSSSSSSGCGMAGCGQPRRGRDGRERARMGTAQSPTHDRADLGEKSHDQLTFVLSIYNSKRSI